MTKQEIWWDAFNSCTRAGLHSSTARTSADEMLMLYEERWPGVADAPVSGHGLDPAVVLRAVSQLEVERRYDAVLVVKSLYEAIKEAQSKGEPLRAWAPPPRGG
jgi:hypothetical protein